MEMYIKTKLVQNLAWSSGAESGRVISKLVTFADVVSTVF